MPALFAGWARRLVDAVAPQPGAVVLDVACGTGAVARIVADRVGASGAVVGLDLNEAMLEVARRIRPDVQWRAGDACRMPFATGSFDLVLSQAGLMWFDDRVAALREMGRVAGRAGRVGVQVPGRLANSAAYLAFADVVGRHAGVAARGVVASYFAVGEPDHLAGLFAAAGLAVQRFESWVGATRLDSLGTFIDAELLPVADQIDPEVRARIVDDCRTALAPYVDAGGAVAAPIEAHLVVAAAA